MKYERIFNESWEYLENNYKGSEISVKLICHELEKRSDTINCLRESIKVMWNNMEFYDLEEKEYYKNYIKENYSIRLK